MEAQSRHLEEPLQRSTLRILLDGRKLFDGGIGSYIRNTIVGLLERDDVKLTVLTSASKREKARVEGVAKSHLSWLIDEAAPYSFDELFLMPKRIDFSHFDLFHSPHYTLPFGIPIPTVITVHDVIQVSHPEKWYYPLIAKPIIRSGLRRAGCVISVSNHSKEEIVALEQGVASKVHHVPNSFRATLRDHFVGKKDVEGEYLLCILSNMKPHKGLVDLLGVYTQYRNVLGNEGLNLVLAGTGVEKLKLESKRSAGITVLGRVSEERLRNLYCHAAALIIPSLIEGFSLPALEAIGYGVPIVSRPIPAVQEFLPPSAVVAASHSIQDLVVALQTFHESRSERSIQAKSDADLVTEFSIESVTERTVQIYRRLTNSRGSKV